LLNFDLCHFLPGNRVNCAMNHFGRQSFWLIWLCIYRDTFITLDTSDSAFTKKRCTFTINTEKKVKIVRCMAFLSSFFLFNQSKYSWL
jgi:hypothetical protein